MKKKREDKFEVIILCAEGTMKFSGRFTILNGY